MAYCFTECLVRDIWGDIPNEYDHLIVHQSDDWRDAMRSNSVRFQLLSKEGYMLVEGLIENKDLENEKAIQAPLTDELVLETFPEVFLIEFLIHGKWTVAIPKGSYDCWYRYRTDAEYVDTFGNIEYWM